MAGRVWGQSDWEFEWTSQNHGAQLFLTKLHLSILSPARLRWHGLDTMACMALGKACIMLVGKILVGV